MSKRDIDRLVLIVSAGNHLLLFWKSNKIKYKEPKSSIIGPHVER